MPLFFFHYHTPDGVTVDEDGCDFPTLEDAYVDAYHSAIDLGAEMLKEHRNPASHRIDIANADGLVLTDIPFDEIFRQRRAVAPPPDPLLGVVRERLAKFHRLRDDLNAMCALARENVEKAHDTLRRAKATI